MKYTAIGFISYTLVIVGLVKFSAPIAEHSPGGGCRDHRVNNCLVVASYVPPNNGGPDTFRGSGTRATEDNCKARGNGDRRECSSTSI